MSGGALDYAWLKVEGIAEDIRSRTDDPLRLEFVEHLLKVAKALRSVELAMSGDIEKDGDRADILAVLNGMRL